MPGRAEERSGAAEAVRLPSPLFKLADPERQSCQCSLTIDSCPIPLGGCLFGNVRAALTVSDAGGKVLARSRPYFLRTDPLLDVLIPADGEYTVELHDMTYQGGLPFRLVISTRPVADWLR